MADDHKPHLKPGGRIEGGIDAVVVGATVDGIAAAALLGKAGLRTVLLGAGGATTEDEPREFWGGYFCADGEHLVDGLDPETIATLDLYRHGLEFARRRLDSVYFFADGGALLMDGDLYRTRESVVAMAEHDGARFADFLESVLDASRALRPFFEGGPLPPLQQSLSTAAERFLSASVAEILDGAFDDPHLKDLLMAEALFRNSQRPHEPFGFVSLLRRWAGETAGLQGAVAYPKNGALGVRRALRRAAQAARVDLRPATGISRVLVEWDKAAGVEMSDGGQIRAPVVINASPAQRAFMDCIGAEHLDIEFQTAIPTARPQFSSARVHFALSGEPGDERTLANMARRLVYAPSLHEHARAFGAARRGGVEPPLIMEAIFPSVFDPGVAPKRCHVVSAILHPVAYRDKPDDEFRDRIEAAARATFERMAPGSEERIVAVDIRLAGDARDGDAVRNLAAPANALDQWARARTLSLSSGIGGYFFCGPEAQIGTGFNGAAGRRAALAAIRYVKKRARA